MATMVSEADAEAQAPRLFISYARVEHARVSRLADALKRGGFQVWWDAALEGGHHFAAEIDRELQAADAVIVVWTRDSVTSHWVLDEASVGRDRNCLIPVRFDETEAPLGFRQLQMIDLDEDDAVQAVGAIGRAVSRITGSKPPPPRPQKPLEKMLGAVQVMMRDDSFTGTGKRRKAEKPAWVPFAWAGFGLLVWIISDALR
jgi:hypothetical protein